jgi:hypothetical protein
MSTNLKRVGKLSISWNLLHDLLKLPEDTKMLRLVEDYHNPYSFNILVESPNLLEVLEFATVPTVTVKQLSGYDE